MKFLAPFVVLALFTGCDSNDKSGPSGRCEPGYTKGCVCESGQPGQRTCSEEGSEFLPCLCIANDTTEPSPESDVLPSDDVATDTIERTMDGTGTDSASPRGDTGPPPPSCEEDKDCPVDLPQCVPQGFCVFCYPGTFQCEGNVSMQCNAQGTAWEVSEDCGASGGTCNAVGVCESICGGFAKLAGTNAGCDFYAVDLHNAKVSTPAAFLNAQDSQFAVVASNTSESAAANVTVTLPNGEVINETVPPQDLVKILLPAEYGMDGTSRSMNAFRVQSSIPIVAYQFNPLANEGVFSNDASVLLPVAAQGIQYRVMTRKHQNLGDVDGDGQDDPWSGYFTVVGVEEAPTSVTVRVTAPTRAGSDLPALGTGEVYTFSVQQGEAVTIASASGDLTGTYVESTARIMVFSGHTAWRSQPGDCCDDHLEQQLPPVSRWGKEFFMGRSMARGNEVDYFRVLAAHNDTQITVGPNAAPGTFSLDAGEYGDFVVNGHVHVQSNQAILVAQFLASRAEVEVQGPCSSADQCGDAYVCEPFSSSSAVDVCILKSCITDADCGDFYACNLDLWTPSNGQRCKAVGDPAMMLGVPMEQWQSNFVFLTPDSYLLDYINVVSAPGTSISLDGAALPESEFEAIGATGYRVYRSAVSDGVHTLEASAPVSVLVYGYDASVSYGYPGGLGLKSL